MALTHYQLMGLQNPKWVEPGVIRTFGGAGDGTRGKNGKLGNQGIPVVFVGYAENHSHDCYRMWNPASCKISESCDVIVIWLHRMYYQDDVTADMAMLLEICMNVHEISQDMIASMKLEGPMCKSGGVDLVHDETEL